jgi:hypothetical protein
VLLRGWRRAVALPQRPLQLHPSGLETRPLLAAGGSCSRAAPNCPDRRRL